jgi:lactosylceramide 4-alpha-galactosyltransferase
MIVLDNILVQFVFKVKRNLNYNDDDDDDDLTKNFIFTETNATRHVMTFRELCAIESAAKHNPKSIVRVFSINAIINDTDLVEEYKNIKFEIINLNKIFNNSILHQFWFENKLSAAKYPIFRVSHLSDALRFLFLYKYGGVYSDLDTITIKDFSLIRKYNGFGSLSNPKEVQAGVLHFTKQHPFILKCLESFNKNYDGNKWAANGPLLIERELALYCNQTNFNHLLIKFNQSNSINCDVGIFPTQFFYPYTWYEFKILFEKNATVSIKKFFNTYSVHFYGKMSESKKMNKNDNSLFEYFASLNCPIMYSKHIL